MTEPQVIHLVGDGGPNVDWPDFEGAIYLCGPVTGVQDFNCNTFREAKKLLVAKGYQHIIDPVEETERHDEMLDIDRGSAEWHDYMLVAVRKLVECQTIILLPGWAESRGAVSELNLAISLKMGVYLLFPTQKLLVQTSRYRMSRH